MVDDDDKNSFPSLDKFRFKDNDSMQNFKVKKISKSPLKRISKLNNDDPTFLKDLPPSLDPNVKVVFIGFNPGVQSSLRQHHYAHFTNLFWKLFNQSKILIKVIDDLSIISNDTLLQQLIQQNSSGEFESFVKAENDFQLIKYGVGFTDLVLRCTKTAQELSKQEKLNNVPRLIDEFKFAKPKFMVFVGKGIWESVLEYLRIDMNMKFKLDKSFKWGRQSIGENLPYNKILQRWDELVGYDFKLYVFPNTSGLMSSLKYDEKLKLWQELADDIYNT